MAAESDTQLLEASIQTFFVHCVDRLIDVPPTDVGRFCTQIGQDVRTVVEKFGMSIAGALESLEAMYTLPDEQLRRELEKLLYEKGWQELEEASTRRLLSDEEIDKYSELQVINS